MAAESVVIVPEYAIANGVVPDIRANGIHAASKFTATDGALRPEKPAE